MIEREDLPLVVVDPQTEAGTSSSQKIVAIPLLVTALLANRSVKAMCL
jgi:hypothetical protein